MTSFRVTEEAVSTLTPRLFDFQQFQALKALNALTLSDNSIQNFTGLPLRFRFTAMSTRLRAMNHQYGECTCPPDT